MEGGDSATMLKQYLEVAEVALGGSSALGMKLDVPQSCVKVAGFAKRVGDSAELLSIVPRGTVPALTK
jgi:hypothetical protein